MQEITNIISGSYESFFLTRGSYDMSLIWSAGIYVVSAALVWLQLVRLNHDSLKSQMRSILENLLHQLRNSAICKFS